METLGEALQNDAMDTYQDKSPARPDGRLRPASATR